MRDEGRLDAMRYWSVLERPSADPHANLAVLLAVELGLFGSLNMKDWLEDQPGPLSLLFVYIPHNLYQFDPCPPFTTALSSVPSAGRTTSRCSFSGTIISKAARTPNCGGWRNRWGAGLWSKAFPVDRGWPFWRTTIPGG